MTCIVGDKYTMHLYTYPYVAYKYTYTNRCFDALSFAAVSLQLQVCLQLICGLRMHIIFSASDKNMAGGVCLFMLLQATQYKNGSFV